MLVAYTNALQIIRALRPVVEKLKTYDANAADQVVRAATSITHNVAEGSRRTGKERKKHYRYAAGSAQEVVAALDQQRHGAGMCMESKCVRCQIASSRCSGASAADAVHLRARA